MLEISNLVGKDQRRNIFQWFIETKYLKVSQILAFNYSSHRQ